MLHRRSALVLVGTLFWLQGCASPPLEPPELTRSERRIVERRQMYGKQTPIQRQTSDGLWQYDSDEDRWNWQRTTRPD